MNYIRLRKNNLCVENVSAQKLVKKYKTPFYCYSLSQLKNNYNSLIKDRLEFAFIAKHIIGFMLLNAFFKT